MKVYLDNGATTMVDKKVVDSMLPFYVDKFGNASSLHQFGVEAKEALDNARKIIANKINADPEEIVFTGSGSESDNLAIKGIAYSNKEKNHIITSKIEHPAVLETCKVLEKQGFEVTYLKVDKEGFIDLNELKNSITNKTCLVSIMHANNEIGTIQDLKKIKDICKEKNVYFHTDAVQSFTKVEIDVKKINVDLISFSSHKIHGPKGVGALYVKKGTEIKKLIHGGHQEFDLRAGTENIPGIVGFAEAVRLGNKEHVTSMAKLRDKLINGLLKIKDTQLNGATGNKRLCNNVNIIFRYIEGESLLLKLDMNEIAVSTGSACSSQDLRPSHVLTALGLRADVAHSSIRFTLSRFTTEKEIDYVLKVIPKLVEELRQFSPLK
ncbi:cysteine desulfurase NifS [archaeon]|nr:cysteine desulfurase NifS [archaeon]